MVYCLTDAGNQDFTAAAVFFARCNFHFHFIEGHQIHQTSTTPLITIERFDGPLPNDPETGMAIGGHFTLKGIQNGRIRGYICHHHINDPERQSIILAHELCHGLDGMVLGNGDYYSSIGEYNDNLTLKVRTAIFDIIGQLIESKRHKIWKTRVRISRMKVAATEMSLMKILSKEKWKERLKQETAADTRINIISQDVCNASEMFADALLQYLCTKYASKMFGSIINSTSLTRFFELEARAHYENFVPQSPTKAIWFRRKMRPSDFQLSFTAKEIATMTPNFDIIWGWLQEHSAFELEAVNNHNLL